MLTKDLSLTHLLCAMLAGAAITFVLYTTLFAPLHAQVMPANGAKLNYRIVGFSFPAKDDATQYTVEIAAGNFTAPKEFADKLQKSVSSDRNRITAEVPAFGNEYTWRIVYKNKKSVVARSDLYHFATGVPPDGPGKIRLNVKTSANKYKDACVLVDESNTMYDMNGQPIWYLPPADPQNLSASRDLKVSANGTMTMIASGIAYDIDYAGKILWRSKNAPPGIVMPNAQNYNCHHELNKLRNGHYMALIYKQEAEPDAPMGYQNPASFFPSKLSGSIAELDREGNIVWLWESQKYLQESDLQALHNMYPRAPIDLHENAFSFDENERVIYVSMSGINRIVKVQYPSGKVLNNYGSTFTMTPLDAAETPVRDMRRVREALKNTQFCGQHSVKRAGNLLCMFNNNMEKGREETPDAAPKDNPRIMAMKEINGALEKVWDFDCSAILDDRAPQNGGGGNIVALSNSSFFVSMSAPYGDLFIVDSNKHISWRAIAEKYQPESNDWKECPKYRASIVTRDQLEQLIWASETDAVVVAKN